MSTNLKGFNSKFKVKEFKIYESKCWIWSLRPVQSTLGAGVLSLKRECPILSDLSQNEFNDLYEIIPIIEKVLKKTFDYDIMNYLMLMMIDKQVHYHIIPRYQNEINFANINWIDSGWPNIPILSEGEEEKEILKEILKEIKMNL